MSEPTRQDHPAHAHEELPDLPEARDAQRADAVKGGGIDTSPTVTPGGLSKAGDVTLKRG